MKSKEKYLNFYQGKINRRSLNRRLQIDKKLFIVYLSCMSASVAFNILVTVTLLRPE